MRKVSLYCDDCGVEIFVDDNMVMINDELWKEISDKHEDAYCDKCIEKRMGRPINVGSLEQVIKSEHNFFVDAGDLKIESDKSTALCNILWYYYKNKK